MTITQVGTATTGTSASSGSVVVNKPSGVQAGDVIVAVGCSIKNAWDTLPSGFTQFAISTDANVTANFRGYAWTKVITGSEGSTFTFGNSSAGTNGAPMVVILVAYRGVGTASPGPIAHSSITTGNGLAEPANPSTALTQTDQGRLLYVRMARRQTPDSTQDIPTFTNGTAGWSELADVGAYSGGSVNYGIGYYGNDADTGAGARVEPAVTCSTTEDSGVFLLAELMAIPEGSFAGSLGAVTSDMSGYHRIDATLNSSLGAVSFVADGIAAPPSGSMASALGSVSASMTGTSVGGDFASTLGSVSYDGLASVNPIGAWASSLGSITAQVQGETRAFGEHVIVVEPEERAFLVTDEGDGLIPIKRSQVTNL